MMTSTFTTILDEIRAATQAFYRGDPQHYINLWSDAEPVSLFGALGPCDTGRADLERAFRWVSSRFGQPDVDINEDVACIGSDMAYTVGYERGTATVDGVRREMTVRVTHIYRLEEGEWKLVHRHGDFAPVDERRLRAG